MRELDMLLLAYVDERYASAQPAEQAAFRRLLTTPDPEILALLTGRSRADDDDLALVIARLLPPGGSDQSA
jgi:antitoxin CptB